MGLLGMLTGWDKSMAAINAIMGSYVMENSGHSTKVMIADEIVKIISSARYGKLSKESILSELNQESRVVQMNFVALACDNLHIQPPFKNSYWERVKNPYATGSQVDDMMIKTAINTFRNEGNGDIIWPGTSTSFDFESLYEVIADKTESGLNKTAVEMAVRLILCFNSYLSEKTQLPDLEYKDMDAVTEMALRYMGIESDQTLFSAYCFTVHDAALKSTLDDGINDGLLGKNLRLKLNFDDSFNSYCRDLGLNHLLQSKINVHTLHENDTLYRNYISEEDEKVFGADLINLIDKVFDHTYSMLLSEKRSNGSVEISQEDINAFGIHLIGCIALYTTHAVINLRSHDKRLPDAMLETTSETLGESFGPDLLDLIARYCAYKASSLD
jgi:hypothetical protein